MLRLLKKSCTKNMRIVESVIFDIDGVIIDS